ncbi:MAG: hypothetical protein U9N52_00770 [Campylobacterota bacterium]|nr:hypothetical protein [Campylobacterota bacterium]
MKSKRALIIKEANAKIYYKDSHLHIVTPYHEQYVGFDQIYGCYINQQITLDINIAMKIAKKVPLYFTNKNGTLIAKISFHV